MSNITQFKSKPNVKTEEYKHKAEIIPLSSIRLKADGTPDLRYGEKEKVGVRESTKMECLYTQDQILSVFNIFKNRIYNAPTLAKEKNARRNLTMFVCAINVGLRGGDFCALKWSDIFDKDWNYKSNADFIPEKTIRYTEDGTVRKCKHIELFWNSDFETALSEWLYWLNDNVEKQKLDGYIFSSQKGDNIEAKEWWRIIENVRKAAGIKQKIGTHGLRKTMGRHYFDCSDDKGVALAQLAWLFGHSDLRTTEIYIGISKDEIQENKENMSFLYKDNRGNFYGKLT